jgi:hypothetical protein
VPTTEYRIRRGPALQLLAAVACFGVVTAASLTKSTMQATIKTVPFKGWKNNLQIVNGAAELIITLDVGPRIISYSLNGGPNMFKEFEDQIGKSGESTWMIRGGHRLWHAPEDAKRTYALDNSPIKYQQLGAGSVRLIQPIESITGIQKEIDITLDSATSHVVLVHRLRNTTKTAVELAPWALSVLAPGGTAIIPLPEKIAHPGSLAPGEKPDLRGFVPNQSLILWPFTDLGDARFRWGTRYITLRQDASAKKPTKLGVSLKTGWVAYIREGYLFVKGIAYTEGRHYPDDGSNFETFTNSEMLEVESLGPLDRIAPGTAVEHREQWWLLKGIPNDTSEAAIDANIRPRVEAIMKR